MPPNPHESTYDTWQYIEEQEDEAWRDEASRDPYQERLTDSFYEPPHVEIVVTAVNLKDFLG